VIPTASTLLHRSQGSPAHPECEPVGSDVPCWLCGGPCVRAMRREAWNGATFTGQNNVRAWHSEWVCEPCVCVAEWKPGMAMPVPVERVRDEEHEAAKTAAAKAKAEARAVKLEAAYAALLADATTKPKALEAARVKAEEARAAVETAAGRDRGANWRNYSLLFDASDAVPLRVLSKGYKAEIRAWLRAEHKGPWFAAIADTGQKHVVPWTPVNLGSRGRIRFEERELALDPSRFGLLDDLEALLTAGATKDEVLAGDYTPSTYQRCGALVETFEARWSSERASVWWDLAVWLSQRDEALVAERLEREKQAQKEKKRGAGRKAEASARGADGVLAAGDPPRVPAEPAGERAQMGGPAADAPADQRTHGRRTRGARDESAQAPVPARAEPRQRALF